MIMNVLVENKGNKTTKLTVTASGDVRIKLGTSIPEKLHHIAVEALSDIAEQVIEFGHDKTMRGTFKLKSHDNIRYAGLIYMKDELHKKSRRVKLEPGEKKPGLNKSFGSAKLATFNVLVNGDLS